MTENPLAETEYDHQLLSIQNLLLLFLAVILGTLAAAVVLPPLLPGLSASLMGSDPKVYWYLARSSAFAAYCLLWLSMVLGVSMSSKLARAWFGNPAAYDIHQFVSLLGLGFVLFHALILLGDRYIGFNLANILIPFANSQYRPGWVGLGQICFYLWLVIALSFYVRKRTGTRVWRTIHFASFGLYLTGLAHGVVAGTDTGTFWAAAFYWGTGGILLFLIIYRVLSALVKRLGSASAR